MTPTAVKTAGAGNLLFTMPGPLTPQGPQNMEYTQYMPGSLHSKDFGQHLGKDRIATEIVNVTIGADDPIGARAFYAEKVGFNLPYPASAYLSLPGNNKEVVAIEPAKFVGQRATVYLAGGPAFHLGKDGFKERGLTFALGGNNDRSFGDPDGNNIIIKGF